MSKKVTIIDIADNLGLSNYTVSRALAGKPGVNEETRRRVIEASKALGYTRNMSAQLDTSKTIVLFIPKTDYEYSAFWMEIVHGIEYSASRNGYFLIIKFIDINTSDIQINIPQGVAGIIYASSKSIELWKKNIVSLPSILFAYPTTKMLDIDVFYSSLYEAAYAICNKLIVWGHKDFAFYGDLNRASSILGLDGMKKTLNENDLAFEYIWTKPEETKAEAIYEILKKLKIENKLPSAIICVNDNFAESLIYMLNKLGISVPNEISVVGYNGNINNNNTIPLTSVGNDNHMLGEMAFDFLLSRIMNPRMPFRRQSVEPKLFIRETAGPSRK